MAAALCAWGLAGGRGAVAAEWVRGAWESIEGWAAGSGGVGGRRRSEKEAMGGRSGWAAL